MDTAPPEFDSKKLRDAFGHFATGVCVVGFVAQDGTKVGITVNSFTSLSLDPPLLLVCLGANLRSHDAMVSSGGFGVSVLADSQQDISGRFATRGGPKWDGMAFVKGHEGALMVPGAIAWFDCEAESTYPAGDHTILIGKVRTFMSDGEKRPLLFFRGAYGQAA